MTATPIRPMTEGYMQTCRIIFADGTEAVFTGRFQIPPTKVNRMRVTTVCLSKAIPLPDGMRFDRLEMEG